MQQNIILPENIFLFLSLYNILVYIVFRQHLSFGFWLPVEEPSQYVVGFRPFAFTNKINKKPETKFSSVDRLFQDWILDTVHMLVSRDNFIKKIIS